MFTECTNMLCFHTINSISCKGILCWCIIGGFYVQGIAVMNYKKL